MSYVLCPVLASPRQANSCSHCGSLGVAVATPPPEVAEQLPFECQVAQAQEACGIMALPACSGSVEGKIISPPGHAHGLHCILSGDHHNRCIPHGVGCSLAEPNSLWAVACSGLFAAHQCAGAMGRAHGAEVFSSIPERTACASAVRQCLNCLSHKPPRGHQVCTAVAGVPGPPAVSGSPLSQPESNVLAGSKELGCRLPLLLQASARGVAASPRHGAQHLGHLWQGRGGPLCHTGVNPLLPLVLLDRGDQHTGPGCPRPRLARGSPLCVSADPSDFSNTAEGPQAGSQATAGSPPLAGEDMVPPASQALPQFTMASPQQERPPVSIRTPDLAPCPSSAATMGLATAGPNPLLTNCSEAVCNTVLNARAPSTRVQYENRCRLFSVWCSYRGEDPIHCSIPKIPDYLQSLLDDGRSPATLRVYVAAISSQHARVDNDTVGRHKLVSLFLKRALRLRPAQALRAPAWDLPLLLEALCQPPFEPLAQTELRWLPVKTAFLLAIILAKRVGELHVLSLSDACLRWNPDGSGVSLWPNTAFLPKVLSASNLNRPIHLAQFNPPEGEERLKLLCPVWALQAYIDATMSMRRSEQLFLCYGGPRKGCGPSKQRLAHWIVDVITNAYKRIGYPLPPGLRCHSTRSISTSWALCAACPWRTYVLQHHGQHQVPLPGPTG